MQLIGKNTLSSMAPEILEWVHAYRFRRYCKKMFWDFQREFSKSIYADGEIRVLSGPFTGMVYFNDVVWGPITPKWIGSYEAELHEVIGEVLTRNYRTIVDIGAAEGYYAVGLARAQPDSQVFSFDIDLFARRLQHRLSRLNQVHNLSIGKRCSYHDLNELLTGGGLVISDIEGFEYELLDPERAPGLKGSDILVEIHRFGEFTAEHVRETIRDRFATTHEAQLVISRTRDISHYKHLFGHLISNEVLEAALNEHRSPHQEWLWLKAV